MPSIPLIISSLFAVTFVTVFPATSLGSVYLGLTSLFPYWQYFVFLLLTIAAYLSLAGLAKHFYVKKYKTLY
jgi:hypothetical protein